MAVAVAESKAPWLDRPSTSLLAVIRSVRVSVWSFSRIGSCKMMPEISGSLLAERILFLMSSELVAK